MVGVDSKGAREVSNTIYAIRNKLNGDTYVGSSTNSKRRCHSHRSLLRRGLSHNCRLQKAWILYGESCFEFIELEDCTVENSLEREQFWLLKEPQYNVTLNVKGGQPKGVIPVCVPNNIGRKHTPEELQKMRIAQQANWSEGGKRWSQRKLLASL